MTDKATLLALAERVEAATGPDERLDRAVAAATAWEHRSGHDWDKVLLWERPRFTASLDAALTLVPEGMIWMLTNSGLEHPTRPDFTKSSAVVDEWESTGPMRECSAATPALALCAAALRARAEAKP